MKPGERFYHYVIGRLLGTGYHGAVYEITHPHTGAAYALKTMHLANVGDASKVRRALSEARGAFSVDHANVIRVFDLNCEPNGLVWMRTELLEGETIAELLGRLGYFSPIFAISVAIEAAHGLQAVHEAQIVHRDVKPANLFYVLDARALKVIDFSIAKVFPDGVNTTVGRAGLGTPAYMAPEQINGLPPTPLVDIYALGITLWQMLAGRHPWQADLNSTSEMVRKHLTAMPEPLAKVAYLPAEVDRVVMRAVAKNPAERYPSMKAFAQALTELRSWLEREAAEGRLALRVPPGEPAPPGDGRSRRDYVAPRLTPPAEEPPEEPSARVIVEDETTVRQVPMKHGGTLPLGASLRDARTTGAGDAQRTERTERGTDILPPPPVEHRSADVAPVSAAPGAVISRATPETPLATMKPASLSTGRHPAALRFRWRSVLAAVLLVSALSGWSAWSLRGHRGPHAAAPSVSTASAASAAPEIPSAAPLSVPIPPPSSSALDAPPAQTAIPEPRAPHEEPRRAVPSPPSPAAQPGARGRPHSAPRKADAPSPAPAPAKFAPTAPPPPAPSSRHVFDVED